MEIDQRVEFEEPIPDTTVREVAIGGFTTFKQLGKYKTLFPLDPEYRWGLNTWWTYVEYEMNLQESYLDQPFGCWRYTAEMDSRLTPVFIGFIILDSLPADYFLQHPIWKTLEEKGFKLFTPSGEDVSQGKMIPGIGIQPLSPYLVWNCDSITKDLTDNARIIPKSYPGQG